MSQELITQIANLQAQQQGFIHQLDATKQMLNEQLASNLQVRTQLLHQNQNMQLVAKQLADAQFENKKLNDDNALHLGKITELDAKITEMTKLSVEETHKENEQNAVDKIVE